MRALILVTGLLSACAPTATAPLRPLASAPTEYVEPLPADFSGQQVKTELEAAVVERFGLAALTRTQSALWGERLLFWAAYAPYLLSSDDAAYRAAVLSTRGCEIRSPGVIGRKHCGPIARKELEELVST